MPLAIALAVRQQRKKNTITDLCLISPSDLHREGGVHRHLITHHRGEGELLAPFCRTMYQQYERFILHVLHVEIFPSFFFSITMFTCVLSCDVEDVETIQPREAGKGHTGAGVLRNSRRCFLRNSLSRQQQEAERTGSCLRACEK